MSLAGQNLHLVVPPQAGPSRYLSDIQFLMAAIVYAWTIFVKRKFGDCLEPVEGLSFMANLDKI